MSELGGWIKLYRKVQGHWLWPNDRPFTKLEAWLDLLMLANHKAVKINVGFQNIQISRGDVFTSQVKLANRWGWNRETVSKYLRLLKTDEMTSIQTSSETRTGYTLISIRNYSKYQDADSVYPGSQTSSQSSSQTTTSPQPDQPPHDTIKNMKKFNNEKEGEEGGARAADLPPEHSPSVPLDWNSDEWLWEFIHTQEFVDIPKEFFLDHLWWVNVATGCNGISVQFLQRVFAALGVYFIKFPMRRPVSKRGWLQKVENFMRKEREIQQANELRQQGNERNRIAEISNYRKGRR